jgi:hypothetical protein
MKAAVLKRLLGRNITLFSELHSGPIKENGWNAMVGNGLSGAVMRCIWISAIERGCFFHLSCAHDSCIDCAVPIRADDIEPSGNRVAAGTSSAPLALF